MARNQDDEFHLLTDAELPEALRTYFYERYKMETAIAAMIERHVEPLKKDLGALIRQAKAESNINRKRLDRRYAEFKDWQDTKNFKDETEAERARAEIRRLDAAMLRSGTGALQPGEQGDWITFFYGDVEKSGVDKEKIADAPTPPAPVINADQSQSSAKGEGGGGPAPLTGKTDVAATDKKAEAEVGAVDNSWRQPPNSKDPGTLSDAEQAGYYYQQGERDGLAGLDRKQAFKATGFHARSLRGKSYLSGYDKGFAERTLQLAGAKPKLQLAAVGSVTLDSSAAACLASATKADENHQGAEDEAHAEDEAEPEVHAEGEDPGNGAVAAAALAGAGEQPALAATA